MKADMGMICVIITTEIDRSLNACLEKLKECQLQCLSKINSLHAEMFFTGTQYYQYTLCLIVGQSIATTKMIKATLATPIKDTDDIITTDEPDGIITTDKLDGIITIKDIITTDRTSVTTKESSTVALGNSIERNLAVIVGASLAGVILLLVAMIALILIIAVVLYKAKHNKRNITRSRSVYQQL